MNWPELSCLCGYHSSFWAHVGCWAASFLDPGRCIINNLPINWDLQGRSGVSSATLPHLLIHVQRTLSSSWCCLDTGPCSLLSRPAGPGGLHMGKGDEFTLVPGFAGFTRAAARTSDGSLSSLCGISPNWIPLPTAHVPLPEYVLTLRARVLGEVPLNQILCPKQFSVKVASFLLASS